MKGDLILLATGREPDIKLELLKSEAEARRRLAESGDSTYYLVDPVTLQQRARGKKFLLPRRLKADLVP